MTTVAQIETPDAMAVRLLREAIATEKPKPDSRARPLDCIRAGIDARDAQIVAWCTQEMGIAKSEAEDIASTRDGEGARQSIERAEGRGSAFLEVAILLRGSP